MSDQTTKPERLIAIKEVAKMTSLSESSVRRRVKAGVFPKPIVISKTRSDVSVRTVYVESEVQDWIQSQISAARNEATLVA
jgi:predicted DNA-binding transcriptional regulator AlpA